jgi:hypothetical protein
MCVRACVRACVCPLRGEWWLPADPWLHASFLVGGAFAGFKLEGWEERKRIEINERLEKSKRVTIPGK